MKIFFAGSPCKGVEELMMERSYNRLMSYYNDMNLIKRWFELKRDKSSTNTSNIIIDSGAFTAWTKGSEIDVEEYIKFINENSDVVNLWGQLDKIPGKFGEVPTIQQIEESAELTWENYLYMRNNIVDPDKLLYTFHIGVPFKHLEKALKWRDPKTNEGIKVMAFGGMVGQHANKRREFMDRSFEIIKELSPNIKIHGFGMTSFSLMPHYDLDTVDSTSWIRTSSFGNIYTDAGLIPISDEQKKKKNHFDNLPKQEQEKVRCIAEKAHHSIEDLRTDYRSRMGYNVVYMHEWVESMEKVHSNTSKKRLF